MDFLSAYFPFSPSGRTPGRIPPKNGGEDKENCDSSSPFKDPHSASEEEIQVYKSDSDKTEEAFAEEKKVWNENEVRFIAPLEDRKDAMEAIKLTPKAQMRSSASAKDHSETNSHHSDKKNGTDVYRITQNEDGATKEKPKIGGGDFVLFGFKFNRRPSN